MAPSPAGHRCTARPANTKHSPNAVSITVKQHRVNALCLLGIHDTTIDLILDQRLTRRTNIKPTVVNCVLL